MLNAEQGPITTSHRHDPAFIDDFLRGFWWWGMAMVICILMCTQSNRQIQLLGCFYFASTLFAKVKKISPTTLGGGRGMTKCGL